MTRRSLLAGSAAAASLRRLHAAPPAAGGFQLGSVSYNLLANMDLDEIIRILEATGFAAVELRAGQTHGIEPSIGRQPRAKVKERFEKSKVRLLSYGTECQLQSPNSAERRRQIDIGKSFVDLAHDTGALGVNIRTSGFPKGVSRAVSMRNIGFGLRELAEYGQIRGIEIWLDLHGEGAQDPAVAAEILATAAHPGVGACWNSNPTDVENGSVQKSFTLLGPYVRSVHINELYTDYPYRELFRLLREAHYSRYTLAEVAESKEPERFMRYYKALWEQLSA